MVSASWQFPVLMVRSRAFFLGAVFPGLILLLLLLGGPAFGTTNDISGTADDGAAARSAEPSRQSDDTAGIIEKTGQYVPLDLLFTDENGDQRSLASIIDRPTLLLPVYYSCPAACPLLLGNLAQALNRVLPKPGEDFKVIAFSFDEEDTVAYARQAKANYMRILDKDFPAASWSFLVGDRDSIRKLTGAMGYSFKKVAGHQFIHPNTMICLAGDGKIIRYIYGPDFLPFDLSMAIGEAEKGIPGVTIRKLLNYCFSYDPGNRRYVFNTFRILGLSSFLILALFYLLVLRKGNKPQRPGPR